VKNRSKAELSQLLGERTPVVRILGEQPAKRRELAVQRDGNGDSEFVGTDRKAHNSRGSAGISDPHATVEDLWDCSYSEDRHPKSLPSTFCVLCNLKLDSFDAMRGCQLPEYSKPASIAFNSGNCDACHLPVFGTMISVLAAITRPFANAARFPADDKEENTSWISKT
jgi:hypothetical protein